MVVWSNMHAHNIVKLLRHCGAITIFFKVYGVEIHFLDRTLMNFELKWTEKDRE